MEERPGDKLPEQRTVNLTVDGYDRSFIVYLPLGYNNAGKMPLVFVIHGGSGTPEGMIRLADFRSIADKEKVVLVYPAGYQRNCCLLYTSPSPRDLSTSRMPSSA